MMAFRNARTRHVLQILAGLCFWGAVLVVGCTPGDTVIPPIGDDGSVPDAGTTDAPTGDVTLGECTGGEMACSGACVNVSSDHNHCGSCGVQCASDQVCSRGVCATRCGEGFRQCGSDCVNFNNDSNNC